MKQFDDFKDYVSEEKLNQIVNSRIEKISKKIDEIEFEDGAEEFVWSQRSLIIGLIFDFLEEYHNWLNN